MQIETPAAPASKAYDEIADQPTRYQPCGSYLVVLPVDPESTTKGGLYIPDVVREKPQLARVLALGPEVPHGVNVGDTILFAKYGGHEITESVDIPSGHGGATGYTAERNVLLLPADQVLAVVES